MSKHVATIDDAAANQEEADARIEDDTAELEARQNADGVPVPVMKGTEKMKTADDVMASSEEVAEQAHESRIDKVAFEDGISTAAAEQYIERGRNHD
jgi:hypothetical protein